MRPRAKRENEICVIPHKLITKEGSATKKAIFRAEVLKVIFQPIGSNTLLMMSTNSCNLCYNPSWIHNSFSFCLFTTYSTSQCIPLPVLHVPPFSLVFTHLHSNICICFSFSTLHSHLGNKDTEKSLPRTAFLSVLISCTRAAPFQGKPCCRQNI